MGMAPDGVTVHSDHVVGCVHAPGEFYGDVANPIEIALRCDIELVRVEREYVTVEFDLASVRTAKCLRAFNERGGRRVHVARHVDRERRCSRTSGRPKVPLLRTSAAVQDVPDGTGGVARRPHVDRAHNAVGSPSSRRTALTASSTARTGASSMTRSRRIAWFRLTPTRRSCSTAFASSG